jgi:hypothetical protein
MSNGLVEYFGDLPDPRVRDRTDYPLVEIVFLCISAIVAKISRNALLQSDGD